MPSSSAGAVSSGPEGLSPAQIASWDRAFARAAEGEDRKRDLERNARGATPMRSSEARRRLAAEHALLARMLDELGPVKR
ncbi:MAG TPA: hypothetical protein VNK67_05170 [Burkholderiales bacterium]|nr:hypothetical protein [Burkholderiales bacterium]